MSIFSLTTDFFDRVFKRPIFLAFFVTLLISISYRVIPDFSRLDLIGRDLFFQIRHSLKPIPSEVNNLVFITIDDETAANMKQKWPFPRSIFADAIGRISALSPRVIGFDFVFQGEDPTPESDRLLQDAMQRAGNVIIASYLDNNNQKVSGLTAIQHAAFRSSLVNKLKDRDGVIRRAPIFLEMADGTHESSWESEIYLKAAGFTRPKLFEDGRQIMAEENGRQIIVPARHGIMDINYEARFEDFPRISFWRLLNGSVKPEEVKGKIVLIGLTALAFHDFHDTPLKSMAGLAVNANAILTLLKQNYLIRIPVYVTWILVFLSTWLIWRMTERYSTLISFSVTLAVSLLYAGAGLFLLWWNVIWDLSVAILAGVLVFFFAVLYKQFQTALENIRLREESVRDPLTGFYTRRFLEVHLKLDVKKVLTGSGRRLGSADEVSVVMIDLDNFKLVNDTFGHSEGDRVLKMLGDSIRSSVRKNELVCRFGGDEFCVILPGTALQDAVKFAEKLRLLIVNNPDLSYTTQAGVKSFRVTGSFGVASVKGIKALSAENMLKAADRALYRAKTGGRNQVCQFDPERDVLDAK